MYLQPVSLQWPSLQHSFIDYPIVFALFLLLKLNCAYKQVHSDLLKHSDHRQLDVQPLNSTVSDRDPALWWWIHMSNDAGAPSHSCTYRPVETCCPLTTCLANPWVVQGKGNWFTKFRLRMKIIPSQGSERHITWHLLGCILTPHWRNRNAMSAIHIRHHFPLGIYIPQLHHLHWRKFFLLVSKHCSIFAVNQYKLVSVKLHSFLQHMSLTFVLQLAICFYYLIPTLICLNKTVE